MILYKKIPKTKSLLDNQEIVINICPIPKCGSDLGIDSGHHNSRQMIDIPWHIRREESTVYFYGCI